MTGRRSLEKLRSPPIVLGVLRVADVLVVIAAAWVSFAIRHGVADWPFGYVVVTMIGAIITANMLHAARLYVFEDLTKLPIQVYRLSMALPAVLLILLAFGFFTKTSDEFSRLWAAGWFGLSFVGIVGLRGFVAMRLRVWQRRGWLRRNLVIIGAGEVGRRLVHHLIATNEPGVRLLGLFDDRRSRVPDEIEGYRVLGTVDDLPGFTRAHQVDEIVIALPWDNMARLDACMNRLRSVAANIQLCPDTVGFRLYNRGVRHLAGVPMLSVSELPLSGWSQVVKAMEDRLIAAFLLLLVSPLLAAVALAIRLDGPGPILFRQRRYGFNNEIITVYKFRTMHPDRADPDGARQATRDDPRVTRVGAFLRRHSLDELPQLLNVLKGEMSLVGPRPHAVVHNEQYARLIDGYLGRHKVKPGITGWAQVNGLRGETETVSKMEARVRHDIYYIDNWSLLFDLRILLLTLFVGFRSENAY